MTNRELLIACIAVLAALTIGIIVGEGVGEQVSACRLRPEIEANAARIASLECEISALTDRLLNAQTVVTSWYGPRFHGKRTASGEIYDQRGMTAAHRTLPMGTRLRVTEPISGRSVHVRINDRGPFVRGRSLDLSLGAARALGIEKRGVARVRVEEIGE